MNGYADRLSQYQRFALTAGLTRWIQSRIVILPAALVSGYATFRTRNILEP
jgi:hypothetical protein